MLLAAGVLVHVVLRVEKLLSLVYRCIQFNPSFGIANADSVSLNTTLQKPVLHDVNRFWTRGEFFSNLSCCPVISIVWRVRVSNIVDIFINGMKVRLGESETKRKDRSRMAFA